MKTAVLAIAVALATISLASCAPGWLRSNVVLSDLLTNPDDRTISSARDATNELCEAVEGCIEAWRTDQAEFYRFDSNEHGEAFLVGLREGFQSDRIVVDFVTAPPDDIRQRIEDLVGGAHSLT